MKKIIYTFVSIALFSIKLVFAQAHHPPQAGDNLIRPALNKFVGTWQYVNGIDTLKVILKKENFQFPGKSYGGDWIVGFHQYKKGNNIIESNLQFQNTNVSEDKSDMLGHIDNENDYNLNISFIDRTLNKLVNLKLTMSASQNSLTWSLSEIHGLRVGIRPSTFNTFTLPNNITLTKQP